VLLYVVLFRIPHRISDVPTMLSSLHPFCPSICVTAGTCCSFNEGLVKAATVHWRISKVFAFLFSPSLSVHPELSFIF